MATQSPKKKKLSQKAASGSFVNAPANKTLSSYDHLELYRLMVRIRRFEERSIQSYQQGKIGGFCHTYIGQEAVAVGTISVRGPHDHVITAYRDHGHALAVGMDMNSCMAENYGKVTGCSKGKGGSMHYFDPERRFWGGHGIVGGQTPLGAGIAFAIKYKDLKGACLCYLGDGAVNQGAVHEAYNLAALWSLPVVFVVENNRYSMGTSQERSSAGNPLTKRALAFDMESDSVQGNDLYEVRAKTAQALERAYTTQAPTLLEMHTYRYRGHSMSDPDQTYRNKQEIEAYRKDHDPIELVAQHLKKEGFLTEEQEASIDEDARAEAHASVVFSEESEFPQSSAIQEDIYWELDNSEHKKSEGTLLF